LLPFFVKSGAASFFRKNEKVARIPARFGRHLAIRLVSVRGIAIGRRCAKPWRLP
jgi:hypothetical protein